LFDARLIAAGLLPLAFALSACGSGSTAQSVPVSANGTPTGPIDTGTYPNLNIPPRTAAEQLSKAERDAAVKELSAARQNQPQVRGTASAANENARLRKIGSTHASDTLKAIESSD
jgi:uncharacterized membrane protein